MKKKIANFALFQLGWFACVMGRGSIAIASGLTVLTFHYFFISKSKSEWKFIGIGAIIGVLSDQILITIGLLQTNQQGEWIPCWLVVLWLIFMTCVNHSLSWMKSNKLVAAVCGFVFAPLSYAAGARLGALELGHGWVSLLAVGVNWAWIMPAFAALALLTSCQSGSKNMSPNWSRHVEALKRVQSLKAPEPGGDVEKAALAGLRKFFSVYSTQSIKEQTRDLYAKDAWFGDPFHIIEGVENIEHYYLVMAEPVETCTFSVDSIQRAGDDYYMRWTMDLVSKAAKGEKINTIGLSHIRLNQQGRIVFQQDYWDTSAMLDRIPVVGFWTRFVKKRIDKELKK